MRKSITLLLAFFFISGSLFAQNGNDAYQEQSGESNTADIGQYGNDNEAEQIQSGSYNEVSILQIGDSNLAEQDQSDQTPLDLNDGSQYVNIATIEQLGNDNDAYQTQILDLNIARIVQDGDGNYASQYQEWSQLEGEIIQIGNRNEAYQSQDGDKNRARIHQTGDNNIADQNQEGDLFVEMISEQNGDSNFSEQYQYGGSGTSDDYNTLRIEQDGSQNNASQVQLLVTYNSDAFIIQNGNLNQAAQLQSGESNTATIIQGGMEAFSLEGGDFDFTGESIFFSGNGGFQWNGGTVTFN